MVARLSAGVAKPGVGAIDVTDIEGFATGDTVPYPKALGIPVATAPATCAAIEGMPCIVIPKFCIPTAVSGDILKGAVGVFAIGLAPPAS
jgi:hypothetical protein